MNGTSVKSRRLALILVATMVAMMLSIAQPSHANVYKGCQGEFNVFKRQLTSTCTFIHPSFGQSDLTQYIVEGTSETIVLVTLRYAGFAVAPDGKTVALPLVASNCFGVAHCKAVAPCPRPEEPFTPCPGAGRKMICSAAFPISFTGTFRCAVKVVTR